MAFCSKCGKENNDNSLFCEECGEKLYGTNSAEVTLQKFIQFVNAIIKKGLDFCKKKGLLFKQLSPKKIGVGIIALSLVVTLCVTSLNKSDEDKIIELTNALAISINEGDYKKMIACFEPSAQNQMNALLNVGSSLLGSVDLKDLWSLGAVGMSQDEDVYISVYDITVEKDTASADISFSFDEGKSDAIGTVELVKLNGKWYFKNF